MDRDCTCPQGHRWSVSADVSSPPTCPVCGAAPIAPVVVDTPTAKHALVPGYELLKQVGVGDIAIVFKARQLAPNRIVALKMLHGEATDPRIAVERFRREVECLARLEHPNIVRLDEVGEAGGQPYCVLEYLEGGSLTKKLNGSPMPPREAAQLLETIAGAVHYLHGRGVLHRNLKPHDILFAADGTPRLIDFGLAKLVNKEGAPAEAEGTIVGTPFYMAPEQAEGRTAALTTATDVYGLGAVLYECLTGRPPFQARTVLETLQRVCSWEPVPPRSLNHAVPPDLETICLKCLCKEPEHRYPSAQELADELRRHLDGKPVAAGGSGLWKRLFGRP